MTSASTIFDQLKKMGVIKDKSVRSSASNPQDSDWELSVSEWKPADNVSTESECDSDTSSGRNRGWRCKRVRAALKRKRRPVPDRQIRSASNPQDSDWELSASEWKPADNVSTESECDSDTSSGRNRGCKRVRAALKRKRRPVPDRQIRSSSDPQDSECEFSASEWEPTDMSTESECDSDTSSDRNRGRKRVMASLNRKRSPAPDRQTKRQDIKCTDNANEHVASSSESDCSVEYDALVSQSHCPDPTFQAAVTKQKDRPKKHCCKFCEKFVNKISAHAQNVHGNEAEVCRILSMAKNSKERREAWVQLTKDGDYSHNYNVFKDRRGALIPKYRTAAQKNVDYQYIACPFCKGLYTKKYLSEHIVRCTSKADNAPKNPRLARRDGELLLPVPYDVTNSFYTHVLSRMNKDDVFRCITSDSLILTFGERMYSKKDVEENTPNQVSSRLREIGRLLKVLRQESQMRVNTIFTAMEAANFDLLVQCIRKLAEYDDSTHLFGKGSLALRLGYSLKKCSQIKKSVAVRENDGNAEKQAERFDSLMDGDWYDTISASAGQSIERSKFNKPKLVPSCADIEKVHTLLKQKMSSSDYTVLAKTTLCLVSLFNRKRGGEVQRMKIHDFEKGMLSSCRAHDPEVTKGFTTTENKLIDVLDRVEIRGKFSRRVAILLTKEMVSLIKTVIDLRKTVPGLAETGQYIFATPKGERPFRGSDVIREFAIEAEVSDISLFTATNLRKQVATLSQSLALSEWEQDQLASFLGHDIRIHRSIYRQPLDLLQKAKVAKVLISVNCGMKPVIEDNVDEDDELDDSVVSTRSGIGGKDELSSDEPGLENDSEPKADSGRKEVGERAATEIMVVEETVRGSKTQTTGKNKRRAWSSAEVSAVRRQLRQCIQLNRVPQKEEAELAIAQERDLQSRTWRNVKDYVYNLVKKSKIHVADRKMLTGHAAITKSM